MMSLASWLFTFAVLGAEIKGPVEYSEHGVLHDGVLVRWGNITALTETIPDPTERRNKYEKMARSVSSTAKEHADIARWCAGNGLDDLARQEMEKALTLDDNYAPARKYLGFARDGMTWSPATQLFPAMQRQVGKGAAKRIQLADWCHEHCLFDEEWKILGELLIDESATGKASSSASNPEIIKRVRRHVSDRFPQTELTPPFAGTWKAMPDPTRHHQRRAVNIYALDLMKVDPRGRTHVDNGDQLSQYYGFGAPVYAPADGEVIAAADGYDDLKPGRLGANSCTNGITIMHTDAEFTIYGHLMKGSVAVKRGDRVRRGQLLGRVGNSGVSGVPHLHFSLKSTIRDDQGRGVGVGMPYLFSNFRLVGVNDTSCSIQVSAARPQEGWIMDCPDPSPVATPSTVPNPDKPKMEAYR